MQVPSKWRASEGDTELVLIPWPKHQAGGCVRVLPPGKMDDLLRELDLMPSSDPNKGVLKRLIGGGSERVTVDKSGRVCLPEVIATFADIRSEAVLVGCLDRFEVWSPDRYEAMKALDAVLIHEAFKMME